MNPRSTTKVATRLLMLVCGGALLLAVVGSIGLHTAATSNAALKTVYEDRTVPLTQLGEIGELLIINRSLVGETIARPEPEVIKRNLEQVEANAKSITTIWQAYMATYLTDEEKKLSAEFADQRKAWLEQGLMPAVKAIRDGNQDVARDLAAKDFPRLFDPMKKKMVELVQQQVKVAKAEYEAAGAAYEKARMAQISIALVGLIGCAAFGLWTARSITRALGAEPDAVRQVADAVAAGDLTTPIVLRPDDRGSVMASMKAMQASLATMVTAVRHDADQVATASAQIASGNQDLSGRTEQQAGSLQQAASSMEELGATVRQNADNARQANQLALNASTIAGHGGEVVTQVVQTMRGIDESSRRIADIIGVIDGIAFQTNILALNAAVEAARAGEQGRGFAVVAAEVRSLAQRSAEAAREIKTLIGTSVERVEQGRTLVDQAGQTMGEIVSAIQRVTDIMGEISAASAEQAEGVAQVGQSVTQMDQAVQQNAALVEQGAAAAESLKQQAQSLVQAVARFRLAVQDAANDRSVSPPAWDGQVERRGPDRAINVERLPVAALPAPAAVAPAPALPASSAPKSAPAPARRVESAPVSAPAAPARTGTDDDWETF